MLEVVLSCLELTEPEVTVAKLVANIYEENGFVKDYFLLYFSFDGFKFLDSLFDAVAVHEALSEACSCLDVVIYTEIKCTAVELRH